MKKIHIATMGAGDWRRLLADPESQWERKASAMELAVSWENAQSTARGLPAEVAASLDRQATLSGAQLLLAFPEHKVALKGRGKPSQSDVWALMLTPNGYLSTAVEGKAGEPFASTLGEWLKAASDGKRERLISLCEILQITADPAPELRYQLFHRSASALLEAERFRAPLALMLVQSFREDPISWRDYGAFCQLFGVSAKRGEIHEARRSGPQRLFLGWVDSPVASDTEIARVV
jgi:hypothetical protein